METQHEMILRRIREKLASQSVEETIKQLHECRVENSPTIEEFIGSFNLEKDTFCSFYSTPPESWCFFYYYISGKMKRYLTYFSL